MLNQMDLIAREPLRQMHSNILLYYGFMKSFVNDDISKYWNIPVKTSKDLAESTKFLLLHLYKNSKEEISKYPDVRERRTRLCPCSVLQDMWRVDNNLAFLFEENKEIMNPRDFNCPNERMTIDNFSP